MLNNLVQKIRIGLFNAAKELEYVPNEIIKSEEDVFIESPKDKDHGDFATNIAMKLTKIARKKPLDIANEIISKVNLEDMYLDKIEVAGPGFINLTVKNSYFLGCINKIITEQEHYGESNIGEGKRINLEFVSANPTGYLHIGHGRGAAYGDSLARIMKKAGYNVDKEHYVNDAGNQITNMAYSVYERYKELYGLPIEMKDDYYHGKEIITVAEKVKNLYQDKYLNNFDLEFFRNFGTECLLNNLKTDLEKFNVTFDVWFSEKSLYKEGAVQKVLDKLSNDGYTYEKEGALWLKTSMYGDEKDRVIIKSDGNYTYVLPDIAYHANKLSRGYDHLIDVLGSDHHGYIDRLKAAVTMIGGKSDLIDIEMLQMVRVIENGQELKMSKRSGKAITLMDLIEEVGSDALRYFYVEKSLNTHMDLDLTLMKQKSNDNPVFYAQYAHARICSIFKNFNDLGHKFIPTTTFENINLNRVKDICVLLMKYQSVIEEIATKRLVHKLTHYISELAYELHSYYNDEKVITDDINQTMEKLTVLKAIQIVLKDCLYNIGVSAPEKM